MPATFAHCLIAREAISKLGKSDLYPGVLRMNNQFVVTGAAGPDYPYLTDIVKYGVMQIGHNWANRMHYENVSGFVQAGVKKLSELDNTSEEFEICLAWFSGYVSHLIADALIHPVVNCTVGGTYAFTKDQHGRCELVQDIYLFNKITGADICNVAARDKATFGYLEILDDASDPGDQDKIHRHVKSFWTDILKAAHPHASAYFEQIDPDEWHKHYKSRVDFAADGHSIFRHALDMAEAPRYVPWSTIESSEREKFINNIMLPRGLKSTSYDNLFFQAVDQVVLKWRSLFSAIAHHKVDTEAVFKDWNLDTGVDESKIDLWMEG